MSETKHRARAHEGATYRVRTAPCPRCSSFDTEANYLTDGDELIARICSDCHWCWDVCAEWGGKDGFFNDGDIMEPQR